jgi:hypothetical protein
MSEVARAERTPGSRSSDTRVLHSSQNTVGRDFLILSHKRKDLLYFPISSQIIMLSTVILKLRQGHGRETECRVDRRVPDGCIQPGREAEVSAVDAHARDAPRLWVRRRAVHVVSVQEEMEDAQPNPRGCRLH